MSEMMNDHARGCQGREYVCTCGYDAQREWQPIETAPKDGTGILVAIHEWNEPANRHVFEVVYWKDDCWRSSIFEEVYPPTHWMPIPATPSSPIRAGEETA